MKAIRETAERLKMLIDEQGPGEASLRSIAKRKVDIAVHYASGASPKEWKS